MASLYTFTLKAGVTLSDAAVQYNNQTYNVKSELAAGGGTISTTDSELAGILRKLRTSTGLLLDEGGVVTVSDSSTPETFRLSAAQGVQQITVVGNSYAEGVGAYGDTRNRFTLIAAQALGAGEVNYAKSGAIVYRASDTGGWRATLKRIRPMRANGTERKPAHAGEWVGPAGGEVAVLCRNLNDILVLGIGNMQAFYEALRTEICRMRACAVYDMTDATDGGWTYGGGTATAGSDVGLTDGPYRGLTAPGVWAQRSTPAHWPGGYAHFGLFAGLNIGGAFTISVDGTTVLTSNTGTLATQAGSEVTGCVRRFYIPPGVHTARITAGAATSSGSPVGLNYFSLEPPHCGLVVPIASHQLPAAAEANYTTIYGFHNTDTRTQADAIKAVCNEFQDGLVQMYDMDTVSALNTVNFDEGDLLHPSEVGHTRHGAALAEHIAKHLPYTRRRSMNRWLTVGDLNGYTGATYGTNWTGLTYGVFSPARFRREPDGTITLGGLCGPTVAPANGANPVIMTLPQIVWPDTQVILWASGLGASSVRQGYQLTLSNVDGSVTAQAPSAGTALPGVGSFISLDGLSYKAAK